MKSSGNPKQLVCGVIEMEDEEEKSVTEVKEPDRRKELFRGSGLQAGIVPGEIPAGRTEIAGSISAEEGVRIRGFMTGPI